MDDKVRIVELERKLSAERQRNKNLEVALENSRRWSRTWKRAAKSELDVVNVIRNIRRRRSAVGIDEYGYISRERDEALGQKLAEALRQVDFLDRERQRWMENAEFFKESNQKLRLQVTNLEYKLLAQLGRDGHPKPGK